MIHIIHLLTWWTAGGLPMLLTPNWNPDSILTVAQMSILHLYDLLKSVKRSSCWLDTAGGNIESKYIGTVCVDFVDAAQPSINFQVRINQVRHLPNSTKNLLSQSRLEDARCVVDLHNRVVIFGQQSCCQQGQWPIFYQSNIKFCLCSGACTSGSPCTTTINYALYWNFY